MSNIERCLLSLVPLLALGACAGAKGRGGPELAAKPADEVQMADYERYLAQLASDELEGRKPGTPGEQKTVAYLVEQFKALGLAPGNGDSYTQSVPLVEITAASDSRLSFSGRGYSAELRYGDDAAFGTRRVTPMEAVTDSPIVFAGYGVVAPEYGWNDYAGIDVRGKTVLVLINDPGYASGDPKLFKGRAMTYYGRWTYKFEEASRQGAAAALIIHETEPAAYPWHTVQTGWTGGQIDRVTADGNRSRVAIEGWITQASGDALLRAAGLSYEQAKVRADTRGFKAFELGINASASVRNAIRSSSSANVVALLPGRARRGEYVVYMAHWDHFGRSFAGGDNIFNGAIDNATGTAGLLAIAAAFRNSGRAPERSVLFFAPTGEESGLLGSAYYVENPLAPLAQTVAALNMDSIHFGGPTRDVSVVGWRASELEQYLEVAARRQGRVLTPEPTPEKGFFYRSDHFNFAKAGVPALYFKLGIDDREHGPVWGQKQIDEFYAVRYHQPSDEYRPGDDLRGGLEDLQLMYEVGRELSNSRAWPNWYPTNEFRAARDRSRAIVK
jgi:Zn-dependent M28 family amino/carboxypeptidase